MTARPRDRRRAPVHERLEPDAARGHDDDRAAHAARRVARARPAVAPPVVPTSCLCCAMGHACGTHGAADPGRAREEAHADAIADAVQPHGAPALPGRSVPPGAAAAAVPPAVRAAVEGETGVLLDGVRIARDRGARRAAAAAGAVAITHGRDVSLGRHAPGLDSAPGRWLLAHELTHAAQQIGGAAPRLRRWPPDGNFHDPDEVMSDVPGAIPGDAMDPTSGLDVDEIVRVAAPVLAGERRRRDDEEQTYTIHSGIISRIPISAYAVPRTHLSLDPAGAVPAAAPAESAAVPAVAPEIAAGTTVYGEARVPLAVLASDPANVVVESSIAVHHAVGAGSCILVRTTSGWYLFDAGINITESNVIADAVVARIAARLGGEPLRGVFLTHAHYDHVSLLSRLARQVQIEHIVANPLQFTRESYTEVRDAIRAADLERRAEARTRLEADVEARRFFVESLGTSGSPDAIHDEDVARRWRDEVARRVEAASPELRESVAIPVRGEGGPAFDTVGTRPLHTDAEHRSVPVEEILPSRDGTTLRGAVDPDLRGRAARGETAMAEHEVDRMSTTYVLTIDGRRLIVMPDLRRTDVNRLAGELRQVLGGRSVEFQEWVLGHHAQAGFLEGVVSARTLRQTLALLHEFRAAGHDGRAGRDAVVASVDGAQVDPAQIRLLRLLGFETFLARTPADIHTYDILSGGRVLRGVRGPLAPGASGEPTLRRSIAGRAEMQRELERLRREHRRTGPRAEADARRARIAEMRTRISEIAALEERLIDAARAEPHDAAATAEAERVLNERLTAEGVAAVATSSSRLTDTALVLLREPLGPEPDPDTPEGRRRARDVALREVRSRVDLLREHARGADAAARQGAYAELYAELVRYEHMLAAEGTAVDPGVTRTVIEAELNSVRTERGSLEGSFRTGEAVRLPDGHLAETRLVVVTPPAGAARAPGPSPLARSMLRGLNVVGRGLGAVMVVTTIRGSADLIDRYERGEANLAQLGIGTSRLITSGVVGVRMLVGARVHPGVFVAMSLLEVGEAVAGDYDSATARRRAIDHAVRNAAINTGCLIVGELLIATANPIGIAVGAVVMFFGPAIIDALFGDDPPETLYPDEVEVVDRALAGLVDEYEAVMGGLALLRRDARGRADVGLDEDIRASGEASIVEHRMRALYLETQILPAFERAYARVGGGRAGLREIDQMRERFLDLRARASSDETDEETRGAINALADEEEDMDRDIDGMELPTIPPRGFRMPVERDAEGRVLSVRESTLRRFREMERNLSLDRLSVEAIHNLEQFTSIRRAAVDLAVEVLRNQPIDPDWGELLQRQRELEARLASARYRLDPASHYDPAGPVARHVPLLAPGTPQRQAYEEELARAASFVRGTEMLLLRSHWINFRIEGVETPNIEGLGTGGTLSGRDRRIAMADDGLDLYLRTLDEIGHPPDVVGDAETLYREPSARVIYLEQLANNPTFRRLMRRLEVTEIATRSLLRSLDDELRIAAGVGPPAPPEAIEATSPQGRLNALHDRFRLLQNDRRVRRGLMYAHEVEELGTRERERAIAYYAPLLGGGTGERPLSHEETVALRTGDYGAVGERALGVPRTLMARLALVPGLRAPVGATEVTDASGTTMRVSRSLGGIMRLDGLTSDERLLVGVVERLLVGVSVVPLNDAAVRVLGGYGPTVVLPSRLIAATEDDLTS